MTARKVGAGRPSPVPGEPHAVPPPGSYSGRPRAARCGVAPSRTPRPARHAFCRSAFTLPAERTTSASSCPMTNAGDPGTSFLVSAGPKLSPGHPRPRLSQDSDSGRDTICTACTASPRARTPRTRGTARTCERAHAGARSPPSSKARGRFAARSAPVPRRRPPSARTSVPRRRSAALQWRSRSQPPPRPLPPHSRLLRRPESASPWAQARPRGRSRGLLRERRLGPR